MSQMENPYAAKILPDDSDEILPFGPGIYYYFRGFPSATELIEIDRLEYGSNGVANRLVSRIVFCLLFLQLLFAFGYACFNHNTSLMLSSSLGLGLFGIWFVLRRKKHSVLTSFAESMRQNASGSSVDYCGAVYEEGVSIHLNSKQYDLTWKHFTRFHSFQNVAMLYLISRGHPYLPFSMSQFQSRQEWMTFCSKATNELKKSTKA